MSEIFNTIFGFGTAFNTIPWERLWHQEFEAGDSVGTGDVHSLLLIALGTMCSEPSASFGSGLEWCQEHLAFCGLNGHCVIKMVLLTSLPQSKEIFEEEQKDNYWWLF